MVIVGSGKRVAVGDSQILVRGLRIVEVCGHDLQRHQLFIRVLRIVLLGLFQIDRSFKYASRSLML